MISGDLFVWPGASCIALADSMSELRTRVLGRSECVCDLVQGLRDSSHNDSPATVSSKTVLADYFRGCDNRDYEFFCNQLITCNR